jgi:Ca2+-binding RTX toxin-like protein
MRANHSDDLRLGETGEGWRTEVRLDAGTNLRTIIPAVEADETAGLDSVGNTTGTASALAIGASTNGFVNAAGDQDWYAVTMVAGESYSFSLTGSTLQDPYIELYDASGALIGFDDDFGPGINSLLRWTATTSGTYYINAQAFPASGGTGSYTLTAQTSAAASPLDAIDYHYMMPTTNIAVWFSTPGYTNPTGDATLRSWTTGEINAVMAALATYSAIAPLTFSVAASQATATWTFTLANLTGNTLGYFAVGSQYAAFDPTVSNFTAGLTPGGNSWTTIIHEAGHGLGMAHPHDNGAANYGANNSEVMQGVTDAFNSVGTFLLNQGVFTTMSYNDGWYSGFGVPPSNLVGNQATPMALDIALIQQVYGINSTTGLGNSTYALAPTNSAYRSIWDNGGTDTISYTGASSATIDLRAATLLNAVGGGGYVSFVQGIHGGWTIANGVVIENATGGNGNDTLIGNSADNVLDGGAGVDTMQGGDGNDTYAVSTLLDVVVETPSGGADTVRSSIDNYQLGTNVENLVLLGGAVTGRGNALANTMTGNGLSNALLGFAGNDTLDGGVGADYLAGGTDDDIYYIDTSSDNVVENVGEGNDTVVASVAYAMTLNVETLYLAGSVLYGVGNSQNNIIFANSANNELQGLGGNDTLYGGDGVDLLYGQDGDDNLFGEGGGDALVGGDGSDSLVGGADADYMAGGIGNDYYYVDNSGDNPVEQSGEGSDVIFASVSYAMTLNTEIMYLTGAVPYGVGNTQDNVIYGNAAFNELQGLAGNDTLYGGDSDDLLYGQDGNDFLYGEIGADALVGGDGNDVLDGGVGIDYLLGGAGDDAYYIDNGSDFAAESAAGGNDTIYASVNYTATANVENLILIGSALYANGNSENNTLTGNALGNEIRGFDGNDTIIGGGATDFLYGGAGADTFVYQAASDAAPPSLDAIMDFQIGVDHIDLTAVRTGANDTFFFTTNGGNTFLHVDLGGNGSDDLLINIYQTTGVTNPDIIWGP